MKKLFLLSIGAALSIGASAQSSSFRPSHASSANVVFPISTGVVNGRTSSVGGSDTLTNWTGIDTLALYEAAMAAVDGDDSGFCAGMDAYGDSAFAERYDFDITDSSLQVVGVIALFGGSVSPTSTNNVNFHVWSEGAPVALPNSLTTGAPTTLWYESGFPNTVLASQSVPFTQLGISTTFGGEDTAKIFMFSTPTGYIGNTASAGSFFVGFSLTYSYPFSGDTIGLFSNTYGERTGPEAFYVGTDDTVVNNVNVTQYSDGSWNDNATSNFLLYYNYYLFPIVNVGSTLSVNGITKNNLTFFGNYPNPAADNTNIKFSLVNSTDVTITIMDMAGHMINTIKVANAAAGVSIVPVNTSAMAPGDYLYLVHTATGEGMAGKMTIAK